MKETKRLFDCIEHQLTASPIEDMLAGKEDGVWKKYSTNEVSKIVNELSVGLLTLGISGGNDNTPEGKDKISIISKNRPEWLMVDLAVQQLGAVLTPVYPTININELEFILQDAEVKIVFVNDLDLYEKVSSLKARLPHLIEIFSFDKIDGVPHWKQILNTNAGLLTRVKSLSDKVVSEDVATIIYTSGKQIIRAFYISERTNPFFFF
jgi:long-chain acyl-CoA synthetase